jgi:excinuclease UvrABC helicase subunit UvrB
MPLEARLEERIEADPAILREPHLCSSVDEYRPHTATSSTSSPLMAMASYTPSN